MAANRHIHEATAAHQAEVERRAQMAQAEEESAELLARGPPDMQWTSALDEPPEHHPLSDVAPSELQDDLHFINEDKYFDNPAVPRSVASSNWSTSSEDGGWDGMVPDDVPPVDYQTPHTAGTSERSRTKGVKNPEWWPFCAKEYLISSLVIGHTRTIISRMLYQHIKLMFILCGTLLPDWTTVRRGKAKLRKMIGINVIGRRSVLNRPVHYLSLKATLGLELANPQVEPHLHYYPELTEGRAVSRLSQSSKWLKELGPNTRAQMVRHGGHDYYLHELVELKSSLIVVPAYFCEFKGKMYGLCQTPEIRACNQTGQLIFSITKDPPFDSPRLTRIAVEEFGMEYPSMTVEGGGLMSDLCGNQIYCEPWNITF
ncbi:hypothetical protein PGTUg99_034357 [Puccinia graminis f. sp. tritici]|uniref:Uncharacterized protein n=1 Tax=Puccinia graminis f. sp. tritici TaxID=56615 RepID=A0A5B0P3Z6_PUCGR|nr:hypothetical protein PGTUg99_034357 [Puccinia graminis f. sp. tritici]